MHTPCAYRLYNIRLHRTGVDQHPISRIALWFEDARVRTERYDTGNLKRRIWLIYLIPYRFAESLCKIALSFPRCANIRVRMDSPTTGISCTWAAARPGARAWFLRKQRPSRLKAASAPRILDSGKTSALNFLPVSSDSSRVRELRPACSSPTRDARAARRGPGRAPARFRLRMEAGCP